MAKREREGRKKKNEKKKNKGGQMRGETIENGFLEVMLEQSELQKETNLKV